ncbi:MAG: branched-chain amino acid ABC transporter permease [Candidatus Hodarchaeales archaeon]|jgi:branched-chain amino acid transport system permease protein
MTEQIQVEDQKSSEFFLFKGNSILIIIFSIVAYFLFLNIFIDQTKPGVNSIIITIQIFAFAAIFGIAALSLNLEIGNTGLTNFGKVAFIMAGSYGTGLFILLGYNIIFAFIIGIAISGFLGYLVTIPTLNLRQDYLAIVTIAIGEVLRTFFKTEGWFQYPQDGSYGGPLGLKVPNTFYFLFQEDIIIGDLVIDGGLLSSFVFMIIMTIFLVIVYIILEFLYNSPWSRVLKGIRENDVAVESLGKDVVKYKTQAFVLGSAIAGFAGGLWAIYIINFSPDGFFPIITFNLWIIVIIGGLANNKGVLVGSFFFWTINNLTRLYKPELGEILGNVSGIFNSIDTFPFISVIQDLITMDPIFGQNIIFGAILILFLLYRPQGLIPEKPIKTVAIDVAENIKEQE